MRLSELIDTLTQLQATHGDVRIQIERPAAIYDIKALRYAAEAVPTVYIETQ
jgi:hypothetical protein